MPHYVYVSNFLLQVTSFIC